MTLVVSFTQQARLEVIEAIAWYDARAEGLGDRFKVEIDRQLTRISKHPLQFPIMLSDVRRARLRRFPYSLFFRSIQDGIFVIACFHSSRDPRHWQGRT